jgi:hypothetical protein
LTALTTPHCIAYYNKNYSTCSESLSMSPPCASTSYYKPATNVGAAVCIYQACQGGVGEDAGPTSTHLYDNFGGVGGSIVPIGTHGSLQVKTLWSESPPRMSPHTANPWSAPLTKI